MINVLSYIGMSLQTEICLWTLLGLFRTIFDATLFKVNANLKQVWQMKMPPELSLYVQRVLRTMISGVMLVQCFTVYVYLAAYIVLLYPVFLEERPTLVLPWLLLAAVRKLLCELISLALGLGACILLGPARPPCIKFLIVKLVSIMPAFYMWVLVFSYYHTLKMASTFKTFAVASPSSDNDYGLELAVRRRRTKSLLAEDQLRRKLVASLYEEQSHLRDSTTPSIKHITTLELSDDDINEGSDYVNPLTSASEVTATRTMSDHGSYEDWFGNEVALPRDTDRIMEQFVLMLFRLAAYLNKTPSKQDTIVDSNSHTVLEHKTLSCTIPSETMDTPPNVGSSKAKTASYLQEYPQIFLKKPSELLHVKTHIEKSLQIDCNTEIIDHEAQKELGTIKNSSNDTQTNNDSFINSSLKRSDLILKDTKNDDEILRNNGSDFENFNKDSDTHLIDNDLSESIESIINRMKARTTIYVRTVDQSTSDSDISLKSHKRFKIK